MRRFVSFLVTAVLLVVAWLVGTAIIGWLFNLIGALGSLVLFIAGVLILSWWLTRGMGKKKPEPKHGQPVGPS